VFIYIPINIIQSFLVNFDPSLLDMEPLFDPLDDITMSNSLTDDYTNQSTLSYLISSQSRRMPSGKIHFELQTNKQP
jgi:hypothetical protein